VVGITGFRASDIGQYGIEDFSWNVDFNPFGGLWDIPVSMGVGFDIFNPLRDPPTRTSVSPISVLAPATTTWPGDVPTVGDTAVPESPAEAVIDPEYLPTTTVFEDAPGGIYETNRAETDWDAVYDAYVILNAPEMEKEGDVVDWGDVFARGAGAAIGGIFDPFGAGRATTAFFQQPTGVPAAVPAAAVPGAVTMAAGAAGCPPTGPKYGKICLATGVVTPLRRRRRRRLLTSSDIKDLSALKSIVGGAALQGAVVQAVRR